jgi:hypothetical protein
MSEKTPCQTNVEIRYGSEGITLSFTDYPVGEEWNPDLPVTYKIAMNWDESANLVKYIRKANNPLRRWVSALLARWR